jgi:hypothetical protein
MAQSSKMTYKIGKIPAYDKPESLKNQQPKEIFQGQAIPACLTELI